MPGLPPPPDSNSPYTHALPVVVDDRDTPAPEPEPVEALHDAEWHRARQFAYDAAEPLPSHWLPLREALGEVLAEDVTSPIPVPHYASSAMDGYAVAGPQPWTVVFPQPVETDPRKMLTIPPKELYRPVLNLEPGQATRIVTGGLVPAGARAVLRDEYADLSAEGTVLTIAAHAPSAEDIPYGQNIRRTGEEVAAGDVILHAPAVLNPAHIAFAAVCGHDMLPVRRRPRVTLLLTGSEVVEDGIPEPGQVRDAFGPQLPTFVEMLGGSVDQVRRVEDTAKAMLAALTEAPSGMGSVLDARCEVVITTGGTGHSHADHVRAALVELGAVFLLDGLAQRPGHPTFLARLPEDGPFVVGLPGNPLAAMVSTFTVAEPLLARLHGNPVPPTHTVPAAEDLPGQKVTALVPGYLHDGTVSPRDRVGSNMLRGLAHADVILVVPPGGAAAGQDVEVVPLPWR
ncbi:molybdopterin molybdotransferase MoeA [Kocuria rosea]|jgi:molybdopterin molybdotransferase|uniref:molybdopterin molybdotransferase MoeA n=1 Tax=Kocuria rosea TaxID=1275 RepID=UPI00204247C7|nr:molybdopterin molybdotransferase MoeA [Kocuria rosea]MCM3689209.1 molybdopterin molybdotransferase MoeA [Kocuria rosea]HST72444.1 molybdopterin molybdotransferase MoeA [Kocuria rosea]